MLSGNYKYMYTLTSTVETNTDQPEHLLLIQFKQLMCQCLSSVVTQSSVTNTFHMVACPFASTEHENII